jgi:signal transduction histidine kinase
MRVSTPTLSRLSEASAINSLRPSRLIKSESFRLAAAFAALFLALTGVLLVAVLWIVDHTGRAALRSANDADIATIENGYADEGRDEAVEVVKQIVGPQRYADAYPRGTYILLQDDSAGKLAGNLPGFAPQQGALQLPLPEIAYSALRRHRIHHDELSKAVILGRGAYIAPGVYVFVGRSTHELRETRLLILEAFFWIASGALALGCAGGVLFGTQFLRRVDSITKTCEAIIAGRFSERIPINAGGNEWARLARAINEMLGRIESLLENLRQVSSDVAHDLRTPLTRLRTRLEEARGKSLTVPDFDAAVAHAIDDTDQLLALFTALLRLSQIESGSRLGSMSRLSLSELLERVLHLYQPVAEDHQHELTGTIQPGVMVVGDAELLTQMFSNLVENALKHTPAGSHIRIGLVASPVTAYVTDDGPGIPENQRQKVFRRFYQLSGSRSTGGHGLGLSLVAAIASLHNGTVTLVDAAPGLRVSVQFT